MEEAQAEADFYGDEALTEAPPREESLAGAELQSPDDQDDVFGSADELAAAAAPQNRPQAGPDATIEVGAAPPLAEARPPSSEAALAALLASEEDQMPDLGAQSNAALAAPPAVAPAALAEGDQGGPLRRDLDEGVLAILREEADLEAESRRLEAQRNANRRGHADVGMQTQTDLGLDQAGLPQPALTAAQKRLAMLRGEDLDDAPEPARASARRDLLPDVEEINSTLKPEDNGFDPALEGDSVTELTRSHGFRTGFLLAMLLLIVATTLYIYAETLSAALPAAKATLDSYVSFIDGLRVWLNASMDSATEALQGGGS